MYQFASKIQVFDSITREEVFVLRLTRARTIFRFLQYLNVSVIENRIPCTYNHFRYGIDLLIWKRNAISPLWFKLLVRCACLCLCVCCCLDVVFPFFVYMNMNSFRGFDLIFKFAYIYCIDIFFFFYHCISTFSSKSRWIVDQQKWFFETEPRKHRIIYDGEWINKVEVVFIHVHSFY